MQKTAPETVRRIVTEHAVSNLELRVRFVETDLMGVVHHGNYLSYFEAARVEWFRRRGVTSPSWTALGVHLPVVEADVKYRAPARFDDLLIVEARLVELQHASMRFAYRITRGDALVVEGRTRHAAVDMQYKLQRVSSALIASLLSPEVA